MRPKIRAPLALRQSSAHFAQAALAHEVALRAEQLDQLGGADVLFESADVLKGRECGERRSSEI